MSKFWCITLLVHMWIIFPNLWLVLTILVCTSFIWSPPPSNIDPRYLDCHSFSISLSPHLLSATTFAVPSSSLWCRLSLLSWSAGITYGRSVLFSSCVSLSLVVVHMSSCIWWTCFSFGIWIEASSWLTEDPILTRRIGWRRDIYPASAGVQVFTFPFWIVKSLSFH